VKNATIERDRDTALVHLRTMITDGGSVAGPAAESIRLPQSPCSPVGAISEHGRPGDRPYGPSRRESSRQSAHETSLGGYASMTVVASLVHKGNLPSRHEQPLFRQRYD